MWLPWWAYPAACCFLAGAGCAAIVTYPVAYYHRELVELGRRYGRLLMWWQLHRWRPLRRLAAAYRELFRDVAYLCETGQLRPGR